MKAAATAGVGRLVNISTDKAADPSSVLGYTKRIGERLTASFAADTSNSYLSVRFGNVLGSRGSVIDTFRTQIDGGGPLTVTHPEATRYFMTINEAVQLVVQAGAIGAAGEVLVLDMGDPVSIKELAHRLAAMRGKTLEVVFTGLRPGEKIHEQLFGAGENGDQRVHPLVSHVLVEPLSPEAASAIDVLQPPELLIAALAQVTGAAVTPRAGGASRFGQPMSPSRPARTQSHNLPKTARRWSRPQAESTVHVEKATVDDLSAVTLCRRPECCPSRGVLVQVLAASEPG